MYSGDKGIKKWSNGSSDLRARPNPAKFPICEKELNKDLKPGVEAEAGRYPSLRPVLSREQVL